MTPLRPLRVGELLDVAIKLYLRNWRTLLTIGVIVAVPFAIVGLVVSLSTLPARAGVDAGDFGGIFGSPGGDAVATSAGYYVGQGILSVLGLLVNLLVTAASFKAVSDAYLAERPESRPSLAFALRRAPSILWLSLLYFLGIGLAFLALIVPGVYLGVAWAVAVPVLLFEGLRGRRALGRSLRLVRGRWWPTLAVLLAGWIVAGVVGLIIGGLVVEIPAELSRNRAVAAVANSVGTAIGDVLTTPFSAALVAVLYYDLRVRKEGFDLQLMAERLGLPPPAVAPEPVPAGADGAGEDDGERPPYWPPPPGWTPSGRR